MLILKETFQDWNRRDPFKQSAIIAYYAIFSMLGLLVLFSIKMPFVSVY